MKVSKAVVLIKVRYWHSSLGIMLCLCSQSPFPCSVLITFPFEVACDEEINKCVLNWYVLEGIPLKLHICILRSALSQRSDPYRNFRSHNRPPEGLYLDQQPLAPLFPTSWLAARSILHGSCRPQHCSLLELLDSFFSLLHHSKINILSLVSLFLHNCIC